MTTAIILFAHGARDPAWAQPFEAVAAQVRQQASGQHVSLAFLEFMTPDLPTAGRAAMDAGCTSVCVVPLFLGAGGHVRKDLPVMLDELKRQYPQVAWQLSPAIGEVEAVVTAMASAAIKLASSASASHTAPKPLGAGKRQ